MGIDKHSDTIGETKHLFGRFAWLAGGLLVILSIIWLAYAELAPGPGKVIVEWTTATEVNTAGFNLYRTDRSEGPYEQVNSELIPSAIDPILGGKYVYTDTNLVSGRTYYYQLEDVEYSGTTTRHGPLEARAQAARSPLTVPIWWSLLAGGGGLSLTGFIIDRRRR